MWQTFATFCRMVSNPSLKHQLFFFFRMGSLCPITLCLSLPLLFSIVAATEYTAFCFYKDRCDKWSLINQPFHRALRLSWISTGFLCERCWLNVLWQALIESVHALTYSPFHRESSNPPNLWFSFLQGLKNFELKNTFLTKETIFDNLFTFT